MQIDPIIIGLLSQLVCNSPIQGEFDSMPFGTGKNVDGRHA